VSPPSNRALLRKTLRTQLRETRRSLPAAQRIAAADALAQRLLALPMLTQTDPSTAGYAAGYWAMDGEIGLHAFQLRLPKGWIYCLPILHPDDTLRFAPWRPGDPLVTNRYGIPEPDISPDAALHADAMTLVLLPLVGFDAHCHRLGMGGGWYDRSFAFRNSQPAPPWLVGVGFAAQQTDAITHEQWDIRMDAICCENATYFREDRA
jgi:5-formyltetrahydrofolate cyclo-ligase